MKAATIGVFDGVHLGHRYLIEQLHAISDGERPLVVTFPDHPVAMLAPDRAPALLTLPDLKKSLLQALDVEVAMLPFDRDLAATSARDFLRRLRDDYGVDRLLLGFNNRFGSDRGLNHDDYRRLGSEEGIDVITARPLELPLHDNDETARLKVSSTAVRQLVSRGEVKAAAALLGRPHILQGHVESGQRLGRTIDFPTANLSVDRRLCLPATGVYVAEAITPDGNSHPSVVNIGYRPTVDHSAAPSLTIEAHLLDFDKDLYSAPLQLRFLDRLRGERRFDSLDSLRSQISADVARARAFFSSDH